MPGVTVCRLLSAGEGVWGSHQRVHEGGLTVIGFWWTSIVEGKGAGPRRIHCFTQEKMYDRLVTLLMVCQCTLYLLLGGSLRHIWT